VKTTLNLAARHHQAGYMAATVARWLLPLLGLCLLYLLISQGMALTRRNSLEKDLAGMRATVPAENRPARTVSAEAIKRQAEGIAFMDGLVAKDRFSWTKLLDRLEKTLTDGITLTGIEPHYREGSLQIAGLAEDVTALRRYLSSLLRSESLREAYLLQQETRKLKGQFDREQAVVVFRIEIKKAF